MGIAAINSIFHYSHIIPRGLEIHHRTSSQHRRSCSNIINANNLHSDFYLLFIINSSP
jgi:hypothetical protein